MEDELKDLQETAKQIKSDYASDPSSPEYSKRINDLRARVIEFINKHFPDVVHERIYADNLGGFNKGMSLIKEARDIITDEEINDIMSRLRSGTGYH